MKILLAAVAAIVFCASTGLAQTPLRAAVYAAGFSSPVAFIQDTTDRTTQFVVEQGGRIRVVRNGVVLSTDFLDLTGAIVSGGERGLLGMALAPDYAESGRFFVNFTNPDGNTVVARFRRSGNPRVADPNSRFDLLWSTGNRFISQPFANHNGGNLMFGPDGFLYIGMGDGGSAGDPGERAQNPAELLGKMLRIDTNVSDGDPKGYRIPSDNPFVGGVPAGTLPEVWAFGLRNPWRFSFDDPTRGGTGALVIGDVGQNAWEEVDYEPANRGGRNYGWSRIEGTHDYDPSHAPAFLPLRSPIHEYDHGVGQSISGGFVYRGCALGPAYQGRYFFADFVQGRVWSIGLAVDPSTGDAQETNIIEHTTDLGGGGTLGNVSSFGLDAAGELYIVNYSAGTIVKVIGAGSPGAAGDFDCDGRSDVTVYRPSGGVWYALQSSTSNATHSEVQWGSSADIPVPGDYDGDGRTNVAIFRPSTGVWFVLLHPNSAAYVAYQWGASSDVPVPGDYDGDGKTDIAVYRPSNRMWYVLLSTTHSTTFVAYQWGASTDDLPVAGDYDGDGKTDVAIFRPSVGRWYILLSSTNATTYVTYQWGVNTDIPVPADYDGDGRTEIAVYHPATGTWWTLYSATNWTTFTSREWGAATDVPVPGDYDGDGKADVAVFRPSNGIWWTLQSTTNLTTFTTYLWGVSSDYPVLRP